MNLPGDEEHHCCLPRVSKIRTDGTQASDHVTYCDDARIVPFSFLFGAAALARMARVAQHLGIQDAPRKQRFPSQQPGAWAGAVALASPSGVYGFTAKDCWMKTKKILTRVEQQVAADDPSEHSELEKDRFFFVYVGRTCPCMRACLKGFHLTLDSWREGRDEEGWKDPKWKEDPD